MMSIESNKAAVFESNNNNKNTVFSNTMRDVQLHQQLVAASFGGAVSAIVTCPFDVVKTRIQIAPTAPSINPRFGQQVFSSTTDAFIKIIRNEGILTLWRGLAPSLIMTVPNAAIYFNAYEALKKQITKMEPSFPFLVPLVSGALARVVAVSFLAPLELIRTNFQAEQKERSVMSFVKKMGVRRLWLGVGATLSRDVPFSAIYWSSYEFVKKEVKQSIPQTKSGAFVTSFIAGVSSGMLAAVLTTPIDLVKTHIQTSYLSPSFSPSSSLICQGKYSIQRANVSYCGPSSSSSPSSLSSSSPSSSSSCYCPSNSSHSPTTAKEIMKMIYKEEGLKGFMRGWLPRAVKVGPACAIMISSYELIKSIGYDEDENNSG